MVETTQLQIACVVWRLIIIEQSKRTLHGGILSAQNYAESPWGTPVENLQRARYDDSAPHILIEIRATQRSLGVAPNVRAGRGKVGVATFRGLLVDAKVASTKSQPAHEREAWNEAGLAD